MSGTEVGGESKGEVEVERERRERRRMKEEEENLENKSYSSTIHTYSSPTPSYNKLTTCSTPNSD